MAKPTRIYRVLHWENLEGVLEDGGCCAPNHPKKPGRRYVSIHHVSIQGQRASTPIVRGPGGVIHDYVPFYFTPLSPMLYRNKMQPTGDNDGGQEPIICLVTSVERVAQEGREFVFTDGHAIMSLSDQYDDLGDLDKVPWEVIRAKYWDDYADASRRRQSEFLVHRFAPWSLIEGIAVISDAMRQKVEGILKTSAPSVSRPPVRVVASCYF